MCSDVKRKKRVLLVAFHYPPCATSSGLQRSLAFSVHLRALGWQPYVLTVDPRAYEATSTSQLEDIPDDVQVVRTRALDAARDLAVRGRYWSRLAIPDRWTTWWLTAVPAAISLVRRERIDAIWSTYPIATAHSVAATVARVTHRPWIADFRDPLVERHPETGEWFPRNPALREARLRVERKAVKDAARLVFCTHGAKDIVRERFGITDPRRLAVIPNGYEDAAFPAGVPATPGVRRAKRILLHSGVIYPGEDRDPSRLFDALRGLLADGTIRPDDFELRLRNPANEAYFRTLARERGVESIVSVLPGIPYREALTEMLGAEGLLLLQGITSNPAVPAKCYEYLRAARPIVALVHPDGETARTLRDAGVDSLASLTDAPAIARLLKRWLDDDGRSGFGVAPAERVAAYSRRRLTADLARLLDETVVART